MGLAKGRLQCLRGLRARVDEARQGLGDCLLRSAKVVRGLWRACQAEWQAMRIIGHKAAVGPPAMR